MGLGPIFLYHAMSSDGHDKPLCTKAITIIVNFKIVVGDTDKSQFLEAISVIDKFFR